MYICICIYVVSHGLMMKTGTVVYRLNLRDVAGARRCFRCLGLFFLIRLYTQALNPKPLNPKALKTVAPLFRRAVAPPRAARLRRGRLGPDGTGHRTDAAALQHAGAPGLF